MARVKYFTLKYKTGVREEYVDREDIRSVLDFIHEKYPALKDYGYKPDEPKTRVENLTILVNGRNIRFTGGLETKLKDDDDVALLVPSGGG
jgi:MoaD family protein